MKKNILLLMLVINCMLINAQCIVQIQAYAITDDLFCRVMNEFYTQEQNYDYYDDSICSFSVKCLQNYNIDTYSFVMLMSGYGNNETCELLERLKKDTSVMIAKFRNTFIFIDDCENRMRSFFSIKPDIFFIPYNCSQITQKIEHISSDLYVGEDDSSMPNIWICCINDNNFTVLDKIEGTKKRKIVP